MSALLEVWKNCVLLKWFQLKHIILWQLVLSIYVYSTLFPPTDSSTDKYTHKSPSSSTEIT